MHLQGVKGFRYQVCADSGFAVPLVALQCAKSEVTAAYADAGFVSHLRPVPSSMLLLLSIFRCSTQTLERWSQSWAYPALPGSL
jgi:hypothetical protein